MAMLETNEFFSTFGALNIQLHKEQFPLKEIRNLAEKSYTSGNSEIPSLKWKKRLMYILNINPTYRIYNQEKTPNSRYSLGKVGLGAHP